MTNKKIKIFDKLENRQEVEIEIFEQFYQDLSLFLDKWRSNLELPSGLLLFGLIQEAKIEACFEHLNYYQMSGELNHLVNNDLKEMFDDIKELIEGVPK